MSQFSTFVNTNCSFFLFFYGDLKCLDTHTHTHRAMEVNPGLLQEHKPNPTVNKMMQVV